MYNSLEIIGLISRLSDLGLKDRPIGNTNLPIRPAYLKLSLNITSSKQLSLIFFYSFVCLLFSELKFLFSAC